MAETPQILERELAYFTKIKGELLKNHADKFTLIKDEVFVGAFDTAANAYEAGIQRFGNSVFLVRRISEKEEEYRNQAFSLGLIHAPL